MTGVQTCALPIYARSKRALTAFAVFLSKTELGNRIKINCADPGVVDSDMIRMSRWFDGIADVLARPFMSTPKKGALSALSALNAKESGYIYHNSATKKIISNNLIINKNIFPEDEKEFKPKSKNTEKEIIERLINISFSYFKNLSTQEN